MKIVILLVALVATFGYALKKTIDDRILLAERLEAERNVTLNTQDASPQTVAML